jgi:sarcosine oxidase
VVSEAFDVIVLGAGAWGSAAAQHLATRGRRVLCIDRFRPPHTFGSTHGHSRLINSNAETSSKNLELILRSYELWRQLEKESGRDLMQQVGYLFVGSPNSARMQRSLESYGPADVPHEVLLEAEIARRFPQLRLRSGEVGIFDPEAARLDPEACVAAALEIAERNGAVLRFGEIVTDWRADRNKVEVVTSKGSYEADQLIIALGAWTSRLAKVDLPLWVERQVMVWYAYTGNSLCGFSFPAEPSATSLYGIPEAGGGVKVALHHGGTPTDPDSVSSVSNWDLDAVARVVADRVPMLTDVLASATCMYTNTPDMQYAVGSHPTHDRVTILAGGSGRGFHQAQVIGEFAADRADGLKRPDLDWLSPNRFATTGPASPDTP